MKVSRARVAEHRQKIVEAAGRLARERGLDGLTVAAVMQAAGLTHGAFYGHFKSKDELLAATFAELLSRDSVIENLDTYVQSYVSERHRDAPGDGCFFAALGAEAVRNSTAVRRALTDGLRQQLTRLAAAAPGATDAERRRSAIASWSAMVGAVTLARLVDDPALSDEIIDETRAALTA